MARQLPSAFMPWQKAKEAACAAPTHRRIVDIVRRVERGEVTPRPELPFDF